MDESHKYRTLYPSTDALIAYLYKHVNGINRLAFVDFLVSIHFDGRLKAVLDRLERDKAFAEEVSDVINVCMEVDRE